MSAMLDTDYVWTCGRGKKQLRNVDEAKVKRRWGCKTCPAPDLAGHCKGPKLTIEPREV